MDLAKDKESRARFVILIIGCLYQIPCYFCYESISSLQIQLQKFFNINDLQFEMFFTIGLFADIIIGLLSGILISRIGIFFSLVVIPFLNITGQAMFCISLFHSIRSYNLAFWGRILIGSTMSNFSIVQETFCTFYFMGKELSFSIGSLVTFGRLCGFANFFLVPIMYEYTQSVLFIQFVCLGISILSNVLALIQYFIDSKSRMKPNDVLSKINISDIKNLGLNYWLLLIAIALFYPTMISYFSVSSKILQLRFSFTMTQAGKISSLTYLIITFLCPFFGLLSDKYGIRIFIAIMGSFVMFCAHFLIGFLPDKVYRPWQVIFAYALMGIGYPAFSVNIFSSIPIIVKREFVGIAMSFAFVLLSTGNILGTFFNGLLHDHFVSPTYTGYKPVDYYICISLLLSLVVEINILVRDYKYEHFLLSSSNKIVFLKNYFQNY